MKQPRITLTNIARIVGSSLVFFSAHAIAQCTITTPRAPYSLYLPSCSAADYDQPSATNVVANDQAVVNTDYSTMQDADRARAEAHRRQDELNRQNQDVNNRMRGTMEQEQRDQQNLQQMAHQEQDQQGQIDQANQSLGALQARANQAQQAVGAAKPKADASKAALDKANQDLGQANSQAAQKQQAVNQANSEIQSTSAAISQEDAAIAALNTKLAAAADPDKAAIQAQIATETQKSNDLKTKLSGAQARLSSAQGELQAAQAAVAPKQAEVNRAQGESNQANGELQRATQEDSAAKQALQNGQNDLQNKRNNLAQTRQNEQRTQQELQQLRGQEQQLGQQINELRRRLQDADRDVHQAEDTYASWYNKYQQDSGILANAQARLQQVINFILQAEQGVKVIADSDSQADASAELQIVATAEGKAQGKIDGNNEGTNDGIDRDYHVGMGQGIDQATADAVNPSPVSVTPDGDAYPNAKKKGYASGYQTQANAAQVASGKDIGIKNAQRDADKTAQPQQQDAYNQEEQTYRQANLKAVSLGDTSILSGFKGAQGAHSNTGDDSKYNPMIPSSLPHQVLMDFYSSEYDQNYRATLDNQSSYNAIYNPAHDAAEKIAYDKAYALKYEGDRQRGYNQAYAGFTAGVANGSYQRSYDDNYKATYTPWLTKRIGEYRAIGKQQADDLYMNNPVIQIVSISVIDSDHDGINRPGDTLQAIAVVKNFGLVAKSDLMMKASVTGGSASTLIPSTPVASIPGQSIATIALARQVKISDSASEGSSVGVQYILGDAKNSAQAQQSFTRAVLYPVVVKTVDFDGTLIPGQKTNVKVSVQNRSTSDQSLNVVLSADASKISITQATQMVAVAAGQTKILTFELLGSIDARFQQTPIQVNVSQNALAFGQLASTATIISRHASTPDSIGMIVSSNLAIGAGKSIYTMGKLDTWDLRVDGTLTDAVLKDYAASKVVHLMADAASRIDAASVQALVGFMKSGGQIVIWGANLDQSPMFSQLQSITGISSASRAGSVNETLQGDSELTGVSLSLSGQGGVLTVASPKAREVLKSQYGSAGSVMIDNGLNRETRVGRVYVLDIDGAVVNSAFISSLTSTIGAMANPFSQKIELAAKDPRYVPMLLLDIQEEAMTAESDSPKFYLDNKKTNKAYMVLDRMMKSGVNSTSKDAFANGYASMRAMGEKMRNVSSGLEYVMDSVTSGGLFSSKSWKSLFCGIKDNSNHSPYCQTIPGGGGEYSP